jgi:hypothetical protein
MSLVNHNLKYAFAINYAYRYYLPLIPVALKFSTFSLRNPESG